MTDKQPEPIDQGTPVDSEAVSIAMCDEQHDVACEQIAELMRDVEHHIDSLNVSTQHRVTLKLYAGSFADVVEALR